MQLREYQLDVINIILNNNKKSQLFVLPTGAGKTIIFVELTKILLQQNKKVLILAHRIILIDQIKKYIKHNKNLLVITRQSYSNKLGFEPDYIIIDEVHNVDFDTENSQYNKILQKHNQAKIIGFTATPIRLKGGLIYGADKFFKEYDYFLKPKDLIEKNYLVPYKYAIPYDFVDKKHNFKKNSSEKDIENIVVDKILLDAVVDSYKKFARKKTLIFATSIYHSILLQNEFLKNNIPCEIIHSKLSKDHKYNIINSFATDYSNLLINVNMLTEGFDEPSVDTIILARPTFSVALHRQIIGRGLRLSNSKKDCLIVDLVGNLRRLGDINDDLIDKEKKEKEKEPIICPNCEHVSFNVKSCVECGYVFTLTTKQKLLSITKDKDISNLTPQEYEIIDIFAKEQGLEIITNFNTEYKIGSKDTYIVVKIATNKTTLVFVFTEKSLFFLKSFVKKCGLQVIENEGKEPLISYYQALKQQEKYFKFNFIKYQFNGNYPQLISITNIKDHHYAI